MSKILDILGILEQSRIYLIYGARGVGKTFLIINIYKKLIETKLYKPILDILFLPRNIRIFKKIFSDNANRLEKKDTIFFTDYNSSYEIRLNRYKKYLEQIVLGHENITHILIDDILLLENLGEAVLDTFSRLFHYLLLLKQLGLTIILSLKEDYQTLLPIFPHFFITHCDTLIRIRKSRRVRDLFKINLLNNPEFFNLFEPSKFFIEGIKSINSFKIIFRNNDIIFTK